MFVTISSQFEICRRIVFFVWTRFVKADRKKKETACISLGRIICVTTPELKSSI